MAKIIEFQSQGNFGQTKRYLERLSSVAKFKSLEKFAQRGVDALAAATPVDTGLTARSWYYEINRGEGYAEINFMNSNINRGVPIAIILQYGHGTRTGGWVEGRDYINPAIQPIFDSILEDAWKEVTSA